MKTNFPTHLHHPPLANFCLLIPLLISLQIFPPATAFTQTIPLDSTFSNDGKALYDFGNSDDRAFDVALQADGRILLGGASNAGGTYDFALLRYNTDGSLDVTFDGDGAWLLDLGNDQDRIAAIAIQPDQKILAAGNGKPLGSPAEHFAVVRIHPDGTLDSTFGGDGIVFSTVGSDYALGKALALQPDGKIIVGGHAYNGINSDFALARYLPDGDLDTTFGNGGNVITDFGPDQDVLHALVLQADGKILTAGRSLADVALARYLPDGSLDSSFSGDGLFLTNFGWATDNHLTLQPDQKSLVMGSINNDIALLRLLPDGTPDSSFSGDGLLTTDIAGHLDGASAATVQPNGTILVSGEAYTSSYCDFVLVQYLPNGDLDSSFAVNGILTTDFATNNEWAFALTIQLDGKTIAAGEGSNNSNYDFAIARYGTKGETMAISDPGTRPQATLSPNPSSHKTKLILPNDPRFDVTSLQLRILNTLGQIQPIPTTPITIEGEWIKIQIPTETLPIGIYYYELTQAGQVIATGKLLRQDETR